MTKDELGKLLDEKFEKITTELETLDGRLESIEQKQPSIADVFETRSGLRRLDKRLNSVIGKLNKTATKEDLKKLDQRLTSVEKKLSKVEETMATKDDLDTMATKTDLKKLKQELIQEMASAVGDTVMKGLGKLVEENTQRVSRFEEHAGLPPYTS